jgi:hypothetical protein
MESYLPNKHKFCQDVEIVTAASNHFIKFVYFDNTELILELWVNFI